MAIPLSVFCEALPLLQEKYAVHGFQTTALKIEPISALDMMYTDGYAQHYIGKVVEYNYVTNVNVYSIYFTQKGIDGTPHSAKEKVIQEWIQDVVTIYASKQSTQ